MHRFIHIPCVQLHCRSQSHNRHTVYRKTTILAHSVSKTHSNSEAKLTFYLPPSPRTSGRCNSRPNYTKQDNTRKNHSQDKNGILWTTLRHEKTRDNTTMRTCTKYTVLHNKLRSFQRKCPENMSSLFSYSIFYAFKPLSSGWTKCMTTARAVHDRTPGQSIQSN